VSTPPPPYAPPGAKPRSNAAPWIIGCAVVGGVGVVIVGILAVLAIFGMRKFLAAAKTAEARASLGEIAKNAVFEYDARTVTLGGSTVHRLCASATQSVPTSAATISGKKYMSAPSDWEVDVTADAGFSCLKFSMGTPQYYMYSYAADAPGTEVGNGFEATAAGDLNGDAVFSRFVLAGKITSSGVVTVSPAITEINPQE
jgi:type IV pilus assembly protein PilA